MEYDLLLFFSSSSMGRCELEYIQFLGFLLILYNEAFVGIHSRDGLSLILIKP